MNLKSVVRFLRPLVLTPFLIPWLVAAEGIDSPALPAPVRSAAIQKVAEASGVDSSDLKVVDAQPRSWSDGCLGLGGPAELCLAVIVDGWRVEISDTTKTWIVRTDSDGKSVRTE